MKRILIITLLAIICTAVFAQRQIIVLDQETLAPIAGVSVRVDSSKVQKTDQHGRVTVTEPFDSITFSHLAYGKEKLACKEVADTMLMFSTGTTLPELVVTDFGPDLRRAMRAAHERMVSEPRPSSLLSFDLGDILDKRGRRDRKHLKRAKRILQEYDLK